MDTRHTSSDKQRYTDAGEQAARVIGDFISMANEFSKKFDQGFGASASESNGSEQTEARNENRFDTADKPANRASNQNRQSDESYTSSSAQMDEEWRRAGEYLRELRETAGYTIDGFASALNRQDASRTIEAAEAGREVFPKDWFDQAIAVLKHRDPLEFFDKLQNYYQPGEQTSESETSKTVDSQTQRQQKLSSMFAGSAALEDLTNDQFEELMRFMQSNYSAALQLVRKK